MYNVSVRRVQRRARGLKGVVKSNVDADVQCRTVEGRERGTRDRPPLSLLLSTVTRTFCTLSIALHNQKAETRDRMRVPTRVLNLPYIEGPDSSPLSP